MCSVSARAVSKVSTSTRPGPNAWSAGSGWRNAAYVSAAIEPVTAIEAAMRREARSSREPKRRVVPSATTGAGRPSAVGNSRGKSRMPRTSAPRKP